jgi:hypothetical protein
LRAPLKADIQQPEIDFRSSPNCERSFNCDASAECWCLKVERSFDYKAFIIRTGSASCICPVCLTGKALDTDPLSGDDQE